MTSLHPALEIRLTSLEARIAALRQEMSKATAVEKAEELGEIERLERHHAALKDLWHQLNSEDYGFRQDLKAEIEMMADDLATTVEEYIKWINSNYQPDRRPKH